MICQNCSKPIREMTDFEMEDMHIPLFGDAEYTHEETGLCACESEDTYAEPARSALEQSTFTERRSS